MNIWDFRKKYPQYNDMSDEELANRLYKKYYSYAPKEKFLDLFLKPKTTQAIALGAKKGFLESTGETLASAGALVSKLPPLEAAGKSLEKTGEKLEEKGEGIKMRGAPVAETVGKVIGSVPTAIATWETGPLGATALGIGKALHEGRSPGEAFLHGGISGLTRYFEGKIFESIKGIKEIPMGAVKIGATEFASGLAHGALEGDLSPERIKETAEDSAITALATGVLSYAGHYFSSKLPRKEETPSFTGPEFKPEGEAGEEPKKVLELSPFSPFPQLMEGERRVPPREEPIPTGPSSVLPRTALPAAPPRELPSQPSREPLPPSAPTPGLPPKPTYPGLPTQPPAYGLLPGTKIELLLPHEEKALEDAAKKAEQIINADKKGQRKRAQKLAESIEKTLPQKVKSKIAERINEIEKTPPKTEHLQHVPEKPKEIPVKKEVSVPIRRSTALIEERHLGDRSYEDITEQGRKNAIIYPYGHHETAQNIAKIIKDMPQGLPTVYVIDPDLGRRIDAEMKVRFKPFPIAEVRVNPKSENMYKVIYHEVVGHVGMRGLSQIFPDFVSDVNRLWGKLPQRTKDEIFPEDIYQLLYRKHAPEQLNALVQDEKLVHFLDRLESMKRGIPLKISNEAQEAIFSFEKILSKYFKKLGVDWFGEGLPEITRRAFYQANDPSYPYSIPAAMIRSFSFPSTMTEVIKKALNELEVHGKRLFAQHKATPRTEVAGTILRALMAGREFDDHIMLSNEFEEVLFGKSMERREQINKLYPTDEDKLAMISRLEKGEYKNDLEKFYGELWKWIHVKDVKNGIHYNAWINYVPRAYKMENLVKEYERILGTEKPHLSTTPDYTRKRYYQTLKDAMDKGLIPRSLNVEDLFQIRIQAQNKAILLNRLMRAGEAYGFAIESEKLKSPLLQEVYKNWVTIRAPNGRHYKVAPDVWKFVENQLLHRGLYGEDSILGTTFRTISAVKARIMPIKLGLSGFHPLHIAKILFALKLSGKGLIDTGVLDQTSKLLKLYVQKALDKEMPRETFSERILGLWKGEIPLKDASDEELSALQALKEAGASLTPSLEQERQMADAFRQGAEANGVMAVANWIDKHLFRNFNYVLFHEWIPQIKTSAFLKMADDLFKEEPELLKPDKDTVLRRMQKLQRLWDTVDAAFGERVYRNLFWDKTLKEGLIASFLSLGWQLGQLQLYKGAISSVIKALAKRPLTEDEKILGRLFVAYSLVWVVQNALITLAFTGAITDLKDFYYPTVGKDEDGRPIRIQTQEYLKDIPQLFYGLMDNSVPGIQKLLLGGPRIWEMITNKLNTIFAPIYHAITNRDYYGREIMNPAHPLYKQAAEFMAYLIPEFFTPFSLQKALSKPEEFFSSETAKEAVLGVLGFPPAPYLMSLSPTERSIVQFYRRYKGLSPKEEYAAGLIRREKNPQKRAELIRKALSEHKITLDQVIYILHNNMDSYQYMFSKLPPETQIMIYEKMNDKEKAHYFKYLKKFAKMKVMTGATK